MNLGFFSNINIEGINRNLKKSYNVYSPKGYGDWYFDLLNNNNHFDYIFIILDAFELFRSVENNIEKELNNYFNIIDNITTKFTETPIFISTLDYNSKSISSLKDTNFIDKYIENKWLEFLIKKKKNNSNLYIFDLKELIEKEGKNNMYSSKLWYLGGMKYSLLGEKVITLELKKIINAFVKTRKKCLVLDLDNTLWGGVIGEDGLEGIELSEFKEGARFKDFQKRIKEIKELGILLTIVSKNDESYVYEVFEKHLHMVLKKEDFIIKKINWKPKSQNIKEISEELNIGLDSMVFIDDNPVEREEVKSQIPEIIIPEFPVQTSELEGFILNIYNTYFFTLEETKEDKQKTKMYFDNIKRTTEMKKSNSIEDFLKSLNTKVYIWEAKETDVKRTAQLTQKTNQFNLTTKRYTENNLKEFMKNKNYKVYIASVEDKFGDNGIVSVVIIKFENNKAIIDTFLMSCRVMGRYIEDLIIDYVEKECFQKGISLMGAFYFETKKNKSVKDLYERLGYKVISDEKTQKKYSLDKNNKKTRNLIGELIIR